MKDEEARKEFIKKLNEQGYYGETAEKIADKMIESIKKEYENQEPVVDWIKDKDLGVAIDEIRTICGNSLICPDDEMIEIKRMRDANLNVLKNVFPKGDGLYDRNLSYDFGEDYREISRAVNKILKSGRGVFSHNYHVSKNINVIENIRNTDVLLDFAHFCKVQGREIINQIVNNILQLRELESGMTTSEILLKNKQYLKVEAEIALAYDYLKKAELCDRRDALETVYANYENLVSLYELLVPLESAMQKFLDNRIQNIHILNTNPKLPEKLQHMVTEGKRFYEIPASEVTYELFERGPMAGMYAVQIRAVLGDAAWNNMPAKEQTRLLRIAQEYPDCLEGELRKHLK